MCLMAGMLNVDQFKLGPQVVDVEKEVKCVNPKEEIACDLQCSDILICELVDGDVVRNKRHVGVHSYVCNMQPWKHWENLPTAIPCFNIYDSSSDSSHLYDDPHVSNGGVMWVALSQPDIVLTLTGFIGMGT